MHKDGTFHDMQKLADTVAEWRDGNWNVLFANGCFDPLRAKHVRFLELAKGVRGGETGAKLLVAVNGDDSVTRLKGPGRPIFPIQERMDIINGLWCVDWVTYFDDDDPTELIRLVRPNIIAKGGDYESEQVAGHDLVDEVLIIPTNDAWDDIHGAGEAFRPLSINQLLANSVATMIGAAELFRDLGKLYGEKPE